MGKRTELLLKNTKFKIAMAAIAIIIILSIVGPFLTPDPMESQTARYGEPSFDHPLGTDLFGRDVLAQVMMGLRNSLKVGFIAGLLAVGIGVVVGGISGYIGGLFDEGSNLFINIFLTIPVIPVLVILAVVFEQRSIFIVAGLIGALLWPGIARAVRSQVLSLKERKFVDLARISGKEDARIIFGEIFPNMLAYIFIQFCSALGTAIVMEAGITMIGLGSGDITLGLMLYWAVSNQAPHMGVWWWFVPPGIIITLFTGTLVFLGSIMDKVLNPRLRGVI
ncbi:hypothetical protein AKJ41_03265 [candidate division MSBL1 archaeon SCGC-AAA259O05]|uniref:ABC transmembrane type-1 domain-containing protein n=1 Tax=candidate division MSBL1 archaeon SCGC-AAA259O05 TaxID=1698271 RepID=A0A133V3H8_9EURY|nr:hypothetical protein AKJ41_03265 [candidate division MSBL1 archaeon SCGC-AAA259O05]